MEKYFALLKNTHLFQGFSDEEVKSMLDCLSAKLVHFGEFENIYFKGDAISNVGIVVDGKLRLQSEDINGNTAIFCDLNAGDLLGEEFFSGIAHMPFRVWAADSSCIIFLNCEEIFKFCELACEFHSKFVYNIVIMIARKLSMLNQKMEIIQKNTIREKLSAFFKIHIEGNNSLKFTIPYNRRELAEYLCVNRSALSKELCKMRDEGMIAFDRNSFHILISNV